MSKIIVVLYEDFKTAEAAAKQLVRDKKLKTQDVSLLTYESDTSAAAEESRDTGDNTFMAQELGSRRNLGNVHDTLVGLGVSDSDAGDFAEGLRRGNTLLVVQADEAASVDIHQILASHQPINITERAEQWYKTGWTGFRSDEEPYSAEQAASERQRYAAPATTGEQVLPVMEEQLVVGKREVQQGGIRAYTRVVEKPVEETVNLRQERVQVERRPVDRPAETNALETFKEGTIEMTERTEEPVVTKQARVIEEVVLHKDVEQRAETIRDTVRYTDVQIEDIASARGFASMDEEKQREIASKGGMAAHEKGTAHEFTPEEARKVGRKGGETVRQDREYMAEKEDRGTSHEITPEKARKVGRKGGETVRQDREYMAEKEDRVFARDREYDREHMAEIRNVRTADSEPTAADTIEAAHMLNAAPRDTKVDEKANLESNQPRHVSAGIEKDEWPLIISKQYQFYVTIGAKRVGARAGDNLGPLPEPDWGDRSELELLLSLQGDGLRFSPTSKRITLRKAMEDVTEHFTLEPLRAGARNAWIMIQLARELTLLQEYQVTLEVREYAAEVGL